MRYVFAILALVAFTLDSEACHRGGKGGRGHREGRHGKHGGDGCQSAQASGCQGGACAVAPVVGTQAAPAMCLNGEPASGFYWRKDATPDGWGLFRDGVQLGYLYSRAGGDYYSIRENGSWVVDAMPVTKIPVRRDATPVEVLE